MNDINIDNNKIINPFDKLLQYENNGDINNIIIINEFRNVLLMYLWKSGYKLYVISNGINDNPSIKPKLDGCNKKPFDDFDEINHNGYTVNNDVIIIWIIIWEIVE